MDIKAKFIKIDYFITLFVLQKLYFKIFRGYEALHFQPTFKEHLFCVQESKYIFQWNFLERIDRILTC